MNVSVNSSARYDDQVVDLVAFRNLKSPPENATAWYVGIGRAGWLYFDDAGFQAFRKTLNDAHALNVTRSAPPATPNLAEHALDTLNMQNRALAEQARDGGGR